MKKIVLSALIAALPYTAGAQEKTPPVKVTPIVDKTAIWVGDDLHYTIRAVYDSNVEMVLDNFSKDRLPVAPFILRDIDIQHKDWAGGKKAVEITLTLTIFETRKDNVSIPLVPLYYFVRQAGAGDKERPVESVPAPAMPIGLRSLLVVETMVPRAQTPPQGPGLVRALAPMGLGLFGLMGLGGVAGWRAWRRMHPDDMPGALTREQRERIVRASLARLQTDVPAAGENPRSWSGAVAASLRSMMTDLFQIPAAAQTPEEIEAAAVRSGADAGLAAQLKTLLGQCDEVRYGRDGAGADRSRAQIMKAAESLIQAPRWVSA